MAKYRIGFAFLLAAVMPAPVLIGDTVRPYIVLDTLTVSRTETREHSDWRRTDSQGLETRSIRSGSLAMSLSWQDWLAFLAIAPDPSSTGQVSLTYKFFPKMYLGLLYNLNDNKTQSPDSHRQQNQYGLTGFHPFALDDQQRINILWNIVWQRVRGREDPGSGSPEDFKGSGQVATASFRYAYILADNFWYYPGVRLVHQTSRWDYTSTELNRQSSRVEMIPLGLALFL